MIENGSNFIAITVLLIFGGVAVFAMKYGVQFFKAKAEAATSANIDARCAQLEKKSAEQEKRINHLEKLLAEVE